jgi:hypothetical protein
MLTPLLENAKGGFLHHVIVVRQSPTSPKTNELVTGLSDLSMDSETGHGIALILCHCIVMLAMLMLTIHFISLQWSKIPSNRLVLVTILMAASIISAEILVIPRLVFEFSLFPEGATEISTSSANGLLYFNGLFILFASACHVLLLFLRTRVIVEHMHGERLQKVYNFIVIGVGVIGVLAFLVRARLFYEGDTPFTNGLEIAFAILSAFFGACITSVDVISTYWFSQYVKQSSKALGNQTYVSNEFKNIIAKMGTTICVCSILLVIAFIASRIPTQRIPQDWIMVIVMIGSLAICTMWMLMKRNLDKQNTLENARTVSNHAITAEITPMD